MYLWVRVKFKHMTFYVERVQSNGFPSWKVAPLYTFYLDVSLVLIQLALCDHVSFNYECHVMLRMPISEMFQGFQEMHSYHCSCICICFWVCLYSVLQTSVLSSPCFNFTLKGNFAQYDALSNVLAFTPISYSTQTGGKRRGGPGGLNKVCGVSPELQTIVGEPALPRTEVLSP